MAEQPGPEPASQPDACAKVDREFRAALARLTGGIAPEDYGAAWWDWWTQLAASPARQAALSQSALQKAVELCTFAATAAQGQPLPPPAAASGDRRFASDAWNQFPFNVYAHAYQQGAEFLRQATTGVEGLQPRSAQLVEFAASQAAEAVSPSNYLPFNPELLQQTAAEKGQNLARGWQHFVEDLQRMLHGGAAPGTADFQVGEQLAVTPGQVIYRNELIELIQYSPATPDVYAEPVLFVPPWIMKYYILDLSPRNSLVRFLVERGHTVFMISWKNPTAADRDTGMDDYVRRGVLAALDVVGEVVPERKVHAVGYCIGGTVLAMVAAMLARQGDQRLADVSLFAAQTDFAEPGEISLFISPAQLALLEALMHKEGVLDSARMGGAFALLRAHDLLWQPAVNSYLKGQRDTLNDLMAWNADGTRMPWKMHTEYLYGLYLQNDLALGRFQLEGAPVQLSDLKLPLFVVGTETDHVAPWKSVYKIDRLADSSESTFLLTSGGHNAGIVSGPAHPRRHHRLRTRRAGEARLTPDDWLAATPKSPGSWWPVWVDWLAAHSSPQRVAPPPTGSTQHPPLAAAPGEYVLQR